MEMETSRAHTQRERETAQPYITIDICRLPKYFVIFLNHHKFELVLPRETFGTFPPRRTFPTTTTTTTTETSIN